VSQEAQIVGTMPQPIERAVNAAVAAGVISDQPRPISGPTYAEVPDLEKDLATIRRTAAIITELADEANKAAVRNHIECGGAYQKLHDQLAKNSKSDSTRIGWYRAFDLKILKHGRSQAEDLIRIHRAFVAGAPATISRLPSHISPLHFLARRLESGRLIHSELETHLDRGEISPASTLLELRALFKLPPSTPTRKKNEATQPDIQSVIQSITARELLQMASPEQRQNLLHLVFGEHAGTSAAIKTAQELTELMRKNKKAQNILAANGFDLSNFKVIFQVNLTTGR
jgi:hypothetical protein